MGNGICQAVPREWAGVNLPVVSSGPGKKRFHPRWRGMKPRGEMNFAVHDGGVAGNHADVFRAEDVAEGEKCQVIS